MAARRCKLNIWSGQWRGVTFGSLWRVGGAGRAGEGFAAECCTWWVRFFGGTSGLRSRGRGPKSALFELFLKGVSRSRPSASFAVRWICPFGGRLGDGVNALFSHQSYYFFLHFLSTLNFFLQYSSFLSKYLSFHSFSFLHLISLHFLVEIRVTCTVYKSIQTVTLYQIKDTNHIFHSPVNPQKKISPPPRNQVLFFFADLGGNVKLGCIFDLV